MRLHAPSNLRKANSLCSDEKLMSWGLSEFINKVRLTNKYNWFLKIFYRVRCLISFLNVSNKSCNMLLDFIILNNILILIFGAIIILEFILWIYLLQFFRTILIFKTLLHFNVNIGKLPNTLITQRVLRLFDGPTSLILNFTKWILL